MITRLVNGIDIPALGLGTFKLTGPEGVAAVREGIGMGYRHIDTAIMYGNEVEVGQGIAEADVPREDLFVTTKIWYTDLAPDVVAARVPESLERLGLTYVDQLLIHWPNKDIELKGTIEAFVAAREAGYARGIGISNFPTALMREAVEVHDMGPLTNQVEYHPYLDQSAVLGLCREYGMSLTAYLPIARGKVVDDPVIGGIAAKHGKSAAQVSLRWLLQQEGVIAIPKTSQVARLRENFDVFDFELSGAEMAAISSLQGNGRLVNMDWAPEWD